MKPQSQTIARKSVRLEGALEGYLEGEGIQGSQERAGSEDIKAQPRSFPYPSTSNTLDIDDSSIDPKTVKQSNFNDKHLEQTHPLESSLAGSYQSTDSTQVLPASQKPSDLGPKLSQKRKRSQEAEDLLSLVQEEPNHKQPRTSLASCTGDGTLNQKVESLDKNPSNPINHWIEQGSWPKAYFEPDSKMSQPLSPQKSTPAISYTQSVKEGENPPAYSPEYEQTLANAGIFMQHHWGQATISDASKTLCATLLDGEYEAPDHSLFQDALFSITLERVRNQNEARVVRDITPSIVPSAELLYSRGALNLQHLTEEMNVVWTKCMALAGPRPKPDFVVGLMSSAFTADEIEKFKLYTTSGRATLFTGGLYFPFLLCEVKCGEKGLSIADRQNAHSASMAVSAIVQLYRSVSRSEELHREILALSVSHDHESVKIHGHYPLIEGDKTTFYRHLIRTVNITEQEGKEKWTAYKFVRKVYDAFVPIHLERIRSAIAQLPDPDPESIISTTSTENESEVSDSHETATSAPSLQNDGTFKKPKLPQKVMLQQENERLIGQIKQRDEDSKQRSDQFVLQLNQLMSQQKQQLEQLTSQQKQQLEQLTSQQKQQLDQQKQQMDWQKQQLEQLTSQQKQQLDQQKQQLDQQKQQMDWQKQQMDRQTDENGLLKKELKELMDILKQRRG